MHESVLPRHSLELLTRMEILGADTLRGWTLAGGTGLAFRLGHRTSEDLDFFRTDDMDTRELHATLERLGDYEILLRSLTWFEDAETEPMPAMRVPFDWNDCKAFFVREARAIVLN